jgi:hypothetical protein
MAIRGDPNRKPGPQRETLVGSVERVTFHNADTGFAVLKVKARGRRDLVPVVGHAASISAGEFILPRRSSTPCQSRRVVRFRRQLGENSSQMVALILEVGEGAFGIQGNVPNLALSDCFRFLENPSCRAFRQGQILTRLVGREAIYSI